MRNLKKVLTLVLTVAMLLSVMVVGTGAAFSDQDSIKNKEAVDVCTTLNIIAGMEDGSYRPANNVTRAQMCKMICVALNGGKEPTLGTNATPTFSDVRTDPSSSWAESFIESCNSQGIVSGVGGGRFSPSGSVTGTQAARMLLVALGYRADQEGFTGDAWAINVNTRASAKGLYKGIEGIDANAALSRDNAAQMIWNALNAYEVEYVSQLTTVNGQLASELVAQDKVVGSNRDKITMLEDKYEADTFVGIFKGNADSLKLENGLIRVDGKNNASTSVDVNASLPSDLDIQYIGEEVKVLYKDSSTEGTRYQPDKKDTIYGVFVTGSTSVIHATKADIDDLKTGEQKISIDDTKYDLADKVTVVTNYAGTGTDYTGAGVKQTAADTNNGLTTALQGNNGDTIKFIRNSNGKIEAAYVVTSKIAAVTAVNNEKVTINNGVGSIKIADNDIYSDVAKGDVVVVTTLYASGANAATSDDAFNIVKKAEVVSGKVTGYKANVADTSSATVRLDSTTYDVYNKAAMLNNIPDETATAYFSSSDIDETFDLYMVNGYVGAAVQTSETASNYSVVLGISDAGDNAGATFGGLRLEVMNAAGEKSIITVSDDSTVKVGSGYHVGDIVTYTGTEADAVVKVEAAYDSTADAASVTYKDKTKTLNNNVVSGDCVIFAQTADTTVGSASAKYKAYTLRSLDDFTKTGVAFVTKDGKVVAAFVNMGSTPKGATSETVYGIVTDVNGTVKIDSKDYNEYIVAANDKTYTVNVISTAASIEKGALVYFDPAADNTYGVGDVTVTVAGTTVDGKTPKDVYVKEHSTEDNTLTYWTALTGSDANGWKGDEDTVATLSLDDDCVIVYVDAKNNKGASDMGINGIDGVHDYKNARIVTETSGGVETIVAIFVETSGECNIGD